MFRQETPEFVHEREDRIRAAIHDGAAADLYDLQPREELHWTLVGDRASELAVEESLACERRGDVLDFANGVGHGGELPQLAVIMVPTRSPAGGRVSIPRPMA